MDFESAKAYLDGLKAHEKMHSFVYDKENFDLEKLSNLLRHYGVDYSGIRFIHVAGSKGKGSICNFVSNYLWKSGRRVGMFTSPYIVDFRDCFWLDGAVISEEKFTALVADLVRFLSDNSEYTVTLFEALVVLVLKYFVQEGVEYGIFEVGVGGGLDATNVIQAQVAVICSLEEEHLKLLGGSKESIVEAKLGIVKGGEKVIVGFQKEDFDLILRKKLEEVPNVIYVGMNDVRRWGENGAIVFDVLTSLFGAVDEDLLLSVLSHTKIVGRFDVRLVAEKRVVFDIAHTKRSIENLILNLNRYFPGESFVFLVSLMADKNLAEILPLIDAVAERIVFTTSNAERSVAAEDMAKVVKRQVYIENDCEMAFSTALGTVNKNEILVVTGSHFLVSKILRSI